MVTALVGFVLAAEIVLLLLLVTQGTKVDTGRHEERLRRARRTQALIVAAAQGPTTRRHRGSTPEVVLLLEVDGRRIKERWRVSEPGLAQVHQGNVIDVLVDADNSRVLYPAADWAERAFVPSPA